MSGTAELGGECKVYGVEMRDFDGVIAESAKSDLEDDLLTIESGMVHQ